MSVASVLVVENDQFNADYLCRELVKHDFEVCSHYTTGEAAVANIEASSPDLILMDISLDGDIDGIEAAAQIAAKRPTPTIFLSAYTDETTLARARATKPYGYLVKPVSEETLNATLQMLVERLAAERKLREFQEQQREAALVFEATQDGILILDAEHRVTRINHHFCLLTGYAESEVLGQPPYFLDIEQTLTAALFERLDERNEDGHWCSDMNLRKRDGSQFPAKVTVAALHDDGGALDHYVMLIADLTAVRMAEETLYRMAHHDALTGLPNRQLATDRLQRAIDQAKRHQTHMALLFIDLDNFKHINDTCGHAAGDALLRAVAARLQVSVRAVDTVARLGGDEFIVILEDIDNTFAAAQVAHKILDQLCAVVHCDGDIELHTSASIGIALYPEGGTRTEQLIRNADIAMYEAKSAGRNTFAFYSAPKQTAAADQFNAGH